MFSLGNLGGWGWAPGSAGFCPAVPSSWGHSSSSDSNTMPRLVSPTIPELEHKTNLWMSEITLETLQEGWGARRHHLSMVRTTGSPARPGAVWVSPAQPTPRPSLHPKVRREAQGQQVHPLSQKASRVTHSLYTLPLSLSVYTAHVDECGMCCDFSGRLQPVFIEHLPCAEHGAKDLYHRAHSAKGNRQANSQSF